MGRPQFFAARYCSASGSPRLIHIYVAGVGPSYPLMKFHPCFWVSIGHISAIASG